MPLSSPDHLHAAFAEAFAAADVDVLLDLYGAGAIQLQPDGHILRGAADLRAVFVGLLAAGLDMQGVQRQALVAGDVALTSTRYDVHTPGENGDRVTTHVVSAEVSRRQADGSWRVVIDAPSFT